MTRHHRSFTLAGVLLGFLPALLLGLTAGFTARADAPLPVVVSFSILGDLVGQVGGERVAVTTLVGPGGDAHVYEPTPADARALGEAALLVTNGLGFEGWIERLVAAAGFSGTRVVAAADVTPRQVDAGDPSEHGGDVDPHAWQDPANVALYVARIRAGLIEADPEGEQEYRARAEDYLAELATLDKEIRSALAQIPPARRKVVTSHDAFGYFADAYGIAFLAPVGINTEAEASAADLAALIRQIRAEDIPAVFVENISDPRLLDQIRRETGAQPGGTLYSDALSPSDGPAGTYLDLMRHNTATLVSALAPANADPGAQQALKATQ